MTRTTTSTTFPHVDRLQPSLRGIAMPGRGTWTLHRSCFVGVPVDGTVHRAPVLSGAITIGSSADHSLTLDLSTSSRRAAHIVATASGIAGARRGFACYRLDGVAVDMVGDERPVHVTLVFHGVHRRHSNVWAWFSGTIAETQRNRWRRPDPTVVDLIAQPLDGA